MQIISDFNQDTQTAKSKAGSYEWWYFDAKSRDGYSLVIIFYEGNPFSRRYIQALETGKNNLAADYPAISISIYKEGEPIFYSFEEVLPEQAEISPFLPKGSIRQNSFEGTAIDGELKYSVKLNQHVDNGDSLKADLLFSGKHLKNLFKESAKTRDKSNHIWNLVLPNCDVNGSIEIDGFEQFQFDFEGTGYHDHNTGFEPMKNSFDEWYWGRYHFKESTLIYYLMNIEGKWERLGWLINKNNKKVQVLNHFTEGDYSYSKFGLYSAKKIEFRGNGVDGLLQKERVTDSGPFYQRFEGTAFLKTKEGILKGEGISEYIHPNRIYSKIFWPLVNMRIKYPGNVHWVQKNPYLYRWTW